jgi:predicted DNA binding protein
MWIAKIRFNSEGTLIGTLATRHGINIFGFPLSHSVEGEWIIVQLAATIFGGEEEKSKFISDFKKHERTINIEYTGNFMVCVIKEPPHMLWFYNNEMIHIAPAYISEKGYEIITVGSFKRQALMGAARLFEQRYDGKLISINRNNLKSISVMKLGPELTGRQRMAIELAIKKGYYRSPRNTNLIKLAKLAGLSFSTYHVHLRKAEEKLIPYFFE